MDKFILYSIIIHNMKLKIDTIFANIGQNIFQTIFVLLLAIAFITWWQNIPIYNERIISNDEMIVLATIGYVLFTYSILIQSKKYQEYKEMPILDFKIGKDFLSDEFKIGMINHTDNYAKNLNINCIIFNYESNLKNWMMWQCLKMIPLLRYTKLKKFFYDNKGNFFKNKESFSLHNFLISNFPMPYGNQDLDDKGNDSYEPTISAIKQYYPKKTIKFRIYVKVEYESMLDTKSEPIIEEYKFKITKKKFEKIQ